jgi:hypothetical protein
MSKRLTETNGKKSEQKTGMKQSGGEVLTIGCIRELGKSFSNITRIINKSSVNV